MRHIWFAIIISLAAANSRAAAPLTIDQAVGEALANNPQIHAQKAYRQAAVFDEKAARSEFLPKLTAAYAYQSLAESPYVNIYGNQVITNSRDQHHWEVAVTQPLFSGFAISARHRLAQLGIETRELALLQSKQALILQVRQGCFDLLMAEKRLAVAASSAAALAAHERDVRRFHNNGLVPLNDLLKAQVALADAVQQQHRAEAAVGQVRTALALLLGRPYDNTLAIQDAVPMRRPAIELASLIDQAMANRSEIALLERSLRSKANEQLASQSAYYPRIELTGKYQQDGDDLGANHNDFTNQYNASMGVQARWTFFEFGKTRHSAAKARAEYQALEQSLEQARNDIRLQVVEAHLALDVAVRNIDSATAALDQAQEHWRITNLLYQQQLTTSTEVLDARSYLDHAQSAYHEARYGYGTALAGLAWATGTAIQ